MLAKDAVQEEGLTEIIEKIAFGEARYGERIFDQVSNLTQKAIMNSTFNEDKKKYLLGEHIFAELKTHADFGGESNIKHRYADGGEVAKLAEFLRRKASTLNRKVQTQSNKVQRIRKNGNVSDGIGGALNSLVGENPESEYKDLSDLTAELSQINQLLGAIESGDIKHSDKGFVTSRGEIIANNADVIVTNPTVYAERYAGYQTAREAGLQLKQPTTGSGAASTKTRAELEAQAIREGRAESTANAPVKAEKPVDFIAESGGSTNPVGSPATGSVQPVAPADTPSIINTPDNQKVNVTAFQREYNLFAKENNLPVIDEDGVFGPVTQRAIQNWNMNKPGWDNISIHTGKTIDPNTGKESVNLVELRNFKDPETIATNPETVSSVNPLKTKLDNTIGTRTTQTAAQPTTSAPAEQRMTPEERQNLFGNLTDIARAGVGALTAYMNPIPKYKPTDEYIRMRDETFSRNNQGFDALEMSSINQNLQNSYASNVAAIKSATGGGASQGAVLASLGQASNQLNQGYLNAALANSAQRQQNNALYRNAVMTDMQLDQQMFEQDRNAALAQRQAGLQMVDSALKNISGRRYANMMFGANSNYALLNQEMEAGRSSAKSIADRLPELYLESVRRNIK